ncbi:DUF5719 family protein [Rhabdothermincola salaria]|uniref:DUF5719 family protein n=1 Tax=Rhabdothermincola salaria TaxID=2903142 RepID=UPI001E362CD4|nr:DUF5719 family protein [Rhabdothermincola salaria]MCD9623334.1 DUF5719 family protein [Rhabdothermincola salaria]
MSRSAWRVPMLVVLVALLVAAVVVDRDDGRGRSGVRVDQLAPVVAADDAQGSTWYCAAGSATGITEGEGAGAAEHTVVLTNVSDQPVEGRLTAYPDDGDPVMVDVEVGAQDRSEVVLSEVLVAPWAGAVVELDAGSVAVDHELVGPGGSSVSPCASNPSPSWYFPAGTSRAGTTTLLALFNPFPGEASVDISVETEEGTRASPSFQAVLVPGSAVTVIDVGAIVTLRAELAITVTARSGRIIAEQLMVSDGTDDAPVGLTASLGAPSPSPSWIFPDGSPPAEGRTVSYSVLNPTEDEAEVEVQVFLDDPATNGSVEPFTLTVPGGRHDVVEVFTEERLFPEGVASWVLVRSVNDVPIVAGRLEGGIEGTDASGFVASVGSPLVATEWVAPVPAVPDADSAAIVVVNPSAVGEATVTLRALSGGGDVEVPGMGEVVVPAGSRVVIPVEGPALELAGLSVVVAADEPVVVSSAAVVGDDRSAAVAMPVAGTESMPTSLAGPDAFVTEPPVTEPPVTEAPDTSTDGEAPGTDTDADATPAEGDDESTTSVADQPPSDAGEGG